MRDLYKAISNVAAAAHANGDRIDENFRPGERDATAHGLGVVHKDTYLRLEAASDEPRFSVTFPYSLTTALRKSYTAAELSTRAGVDLDSLSESEREDVIQRVTVSDLREADAAFDEFRTALDERIEPVEPEFHFLELTEESLWNGVLVRDYLYPYEEFAIEDYRCVVSRVRSTALEVMALVREIVDAFDRDDIESTSTPQGSTSRTNTGPVAFQ